MLWGFAFLCTLHAFSQEPPPDTISMPHADTGMPAADTAQFLSDTVAVSDTAGLFRQSSTIEDVLDYTANDSVYVDMNTRVAHLFSEAVVNYSGFHLESDYMEVNLPGSEVLARPTLDSLGLEIGVPHFEDSKNSFDAKEIKYNFNTKKGIIKDVMTVQEDVYVHGNVVKKYENDVSFIKNARFTSCDLETPHFDLRAFKAKVVPQKVIVLGSAMMFIENVPTPLVLPFAVIPNQKKHRSGILIPSFGQTRRAGFFFKGFGAYLSINDYFDLKAEADAYTGGNWELRTDFRYAVRYKFSGALHFGYSWIYQDERGLPHRAHQNGFKIQWSHSQDSKARPNSRFSANVNFTNSSYSKYAGNLSDYLTSTTTSNISYSLDFARKLHLALNASADYNTYTRAFNITLPTVNLSVDQLYPFRRRKAVGKRRWYETISFNYSLLAQNNIRATDTNFLSRQTLENMNNGIKQNARLASTVKVFKYMNWTNSFDYSELWYLNNTEKRYDPEQSQLTDIRTKLQHQPFVQRLRYLQIQERLAQGFPPCHDARRRHHLPPRLQQTFLGCLRHLHRPQRRGTPLLQIRQQHLRRASLGHGGQHQPFAQEHVRHEGAQQKRHRERRKENQTHRQSYRKHLLQHGRRLPALGAHHHQRAHCAFPTPQRECGRGFRLLQSRQRRAAVQ